MDFLSISYFQNIIYGAYIIIYFSLAFTRFTWYFVKNT